jgi:GntR family transcriptional regulator
MILASDFGVSAGTLRKALNIMTDEHLITRRQGRGTFVNDPASYGLVNRFSKLCGTDDKPIIGRVETTNLTEGRANKTECLRLQLRDQEPVWRIRRTRFRDNRVYMYEEVSLPAELFLKWKMGVPIALSSSPSSTACYLVRRRSGSRLAQLPARQRRPWT